jgi:hypothetical protein
MQLGGRLRMKLPRGHAFPRSIGVKLCDVGFFQSSFPVVAGLTCHLGRGYLFKGRPRLCAVLLDQSRLIATRAV